MGTQQSNSFKNRIYDFIEQEDKGTKKMIHNSVFLMKSLDVLHRSSDREKDAIKLLLQASQILYKSQQLMNYAVGGMDMKFHKGLLELSDKIDKEIGF